MKLLLRRNQRVGLMGSIVFTLDVRAELSDEERRNISTYQLSKTVLYSRSELADPGKGLLGFASRLAFKMANITVSVEDLAGGKRIECKDVVEMLAVEEQLKQAATTLKQVLHLATQFGGEEAVDIP